MGLSSVYKLMFMADDKGSLSRMRNILKGVGEQSYVTFNAISRNMSKMEKSTGRLIGRLSLLAGSGGVMYSVFKSLNYSIIQSNSLITTNKILLEEIIGNKGKAREMVSVVQELSGSFGADVNEMMTASRGLGQVMRQIDKNFTSDHLGRMLKLVNVVSNLDTENRGLSYTTFSFKEALQGLGAGDWRSMRNRLEINLGKTYEKAITKAVKAGDMDQVVTLFEDAFENIGINAGNIMGRLMNEGLIQNIHRFASYINRTFQLLGEEGFKELTKPLARINFFLSDQFKKDSSFLKTLSGLSAKFSDKFIKPITEMFDELGQIIYPIREEIGTNFVKAIVAVGGVFQNLIGMPFDFIKGLMGIQNGISGTFDKVQTFNEFLKNTKDIASSISKSFAELRDPLNNFGLAIERLVVSLLKLSNLDKGAKVGGSLTSLMANGLNLGAGATDTVTSGVNLADKGSEMFGMDGLMAGVSILSMIAMFRGMRKPKMPKGSNVDDDIFKASNSSSSRGGITNTNPKGKDVWNEPDDLNTGAMNNMEKKITRQKIKNNYNKDAFNEQDKKAYETAGIDQKKLVTKYGGNHLNMKTQYQNKEQEIDKYKKMLEDNNSSTLDKMLAKGKIKTLTKEKDKIEKDINKFNKTITDKHELDQKRKPFTDKPLAEYDKVPPMPSSTPLNINLDRTKQTLTSFVKDGGLMTTAVTASSLIQVGSLIKSGISTNLLAPIKGVGAKLLPFALSIAPITVAMGGLAFSIGALSNMIDKANDKQFKQMEEQFEANSKQLEQNNFLSNGMNKEGIDQKGWRNFLSSKDMSDELIKNMISREMLNDKGIKEGSNTRQLLMLDRMFKNAEAQGLGNASDLSKKLLNYDITKGNFEKLIINNNMHLQNKDGTVTKEDMENARKNMNKIIASHYSKPDAKVKMKSSEYWQSFVKPK